MCSIEYLSNKAILTTSLHMTQSSLLEYRKKYEKLLKKDAIENSNLIRSSENKSELEIFGNEHEAKIRNESVFNNLKILEFKIGNVLSIKHTKLNDLKEKYNDNIRNSIHSNNIDEVDLQSVARQSGPSKIPLLKIPEIPPKFVSYENLSPTKSYENLSPNKSYENLSPNKGVKSPPIISPRVHDLRERMRSPSPPKRMFSPNNSTLEKSIDIGGDTDSGKYFNDSQSEFSQSNLVLDQYLKIFNVIHNLIKTPWNYRNNYLEGSRKRDTIKIESISSLEKLLKAEYVSYAAFSNVKFEDLVSCMLHWLPKFCIELNLDASALANPTFSKQLQQNLKLNFEDLNSKISKALCTSNDIRKLWNTLVDHFEKLIRDKYLTNQEIVEIFTSLLMPLSSTDSNEDEVSKLFNLLFVLIESKNKVDDLVTDSVQDVALFSEDESMNVSSMKEEKPKENQRMSIESALSYNQLKQSLNIVDHSEDDDPNDDINLLFTSPQSKTKNSEAIQSNESKNRLIRSIKNIDDDFISEDFPQIKTEADKNKKSDDSDDFDFYK